MRKREKRGSPPVAFADLRDLIRRAAPEPEVLKLIGDESKANGTDKLTSREIDQIIREARQGRKSRRG